MFTRTIAYPLGIQLLHAVGVLLADRLALELHRGRELVATRQPLVLEQREALDLLHPREAAVGGVHLRLYTLHGLRGSGVQSGFGIQRQQRDVVRAGVTHHARLTDQRAGALERALDV